MNPSLLRCRAKGARHPDWRELYETQDPTTMPWYYPGLDPDLEAVLPSLTGNASFLDIGSGPGNQAAALAALGFRVTGTDISPAAVEAARAAYPGVRFVEDDIVRTTVADRFDYAFDRGCLHVLAPRDYPSYAASVHRLLAPGGLLFLKCFSDENPPRDFGPLAFSEAGIARVFRGALRVESVARTRYHGPRGLSPHALFVTLRRVARRAPG